VLGVFLVATALMLLLLELGLRTFGSLNIHYYTGTKTPGLHQYPYGEIPINADGYPDEEFVRTGTKWRVGYVGDSVTYGVGAGYGYRLPDLLQKAYPQYDHWVFANVGELLDQKNLIGQVERFRLNAVVYLMNLNDIMPDAGDAQASTWITRTRATWLGSLDNFLRGRSYLFTSVRLGLKNTLQRLGYEQHGLPAFELFPRANGPIIEATARRVASALTTATGHGLLRSCVLILPYEMQVSRDAARRYRDLGFKWEAGFEEGSTQAALVAAFERLGVTVLDGREAFTGSDLKIGEAFVYDRGDKIDWNHPTRAGHALLAAWLSQPDRVEKCFAPTRGQLP